eukprot:CAMPEP_0197599514 /NCGR_PEP_ID=MMETSP1326-20131121/31525_1 /TAXON_ID=1155430 /ORGANISM="Genus nov. species nov., Strain RCC2288" /LENGTH=112 /DNA_ID=CAMNT_0043166499 /DNA_START=103 /DNA_END=438 /DNA_ORIENTATION=+
MSCLPRASGPIRSAAALEPADDARQRGVRRRADGLQVLVERPEALQHGGERGQAALGQAAHHVGPQRRLALDEERHQQCGVRLRDQAVARLLARLDHLGGHLAVVLLHHRGV